MNSVTEDYIEEMLRKIDKLRDRINKYEGQYSTNEWLVRYSLIDPFLRLLGWDTENPEEVVPELTIRTNPGQQEKGRPDYTLYKDNNIIAFIGAKKLGNNEDIQQHLNYCNSHGVAYFITTDGDRWSIYNNALYLKPINERKIMDWSILNDPTKEIFIKSLYMSKWFFGLNFYKSNVVELNSKIGYNNENKLTHIETDKTSNKKITGISINGQHIGTTSAKGVLINTFKWILDNNYLKNMQIPLKSGKVRYLINDKPEDQKGKPFKNPAKVGDYYLECHNSHDRAIKLAKLLLKSAGLNPGILKIETW